jgi:predicted AlkP superfamily phosphohydrolase/phosphomutase
MVFTVMSTIKQTAGWTRTMTAASLAAVLAIGACTGGGEGEPGGAGPRRVSFDSFAEYMQEVRASASPGRKTHQVVFIGIDGATWRFLDPLIERGRLPHLRRIKMEGYYGTLLSTACYVSPPAWVAMLTGYSPVKSGVYTFGKFSWEERKFSSLTAEDVSVPWAWDVASQAGRKVAVNNVPLTYPVSPINGVMVSGLLTPVPLGERLLLESTRFSANLGLSRVAPDAVSYSTPIKNEGSDSLNTVVWWHTDSTDDGVRNHDRVVLTVLPRLHTEPEGVAGRVYRFDIGRYSPWLKIRAVWKGKVRDGWCKLKVTRRPDGRFQFMGSQILFDVRESGAQYTYPAELADVLAEELDYYMPSKFLKQDVVPSVTVEAAKYASFLYEYDDWDLFYYVFTQTDNIHHLEGFSKNAAAVYEEIDRFLGDLMRRLPADCTLIIASDHGFNKFTWGVDVNESLEQLGLVVRKPGGEEIDYERTTAFHNMWHLYFNPSLTTREHLAEIGVSVEENESPRDALIRLVNNIKIVTADGKQYPLAFKPLPENLPPDQPDMVVEGAYDDYMVEFWNLMRPRGNLMWKLADSEAHNHDREGIFLVWGNHVRTGIDAGTRTIEDIAPTMLYMLGLPTAADMDGRAMFEAFHDIYLAQNPEYVVNDYREIQREFMAAEKDTESLEKTLRSLGYVQ